MFVSRLILTRFENLITTLVVENIMKQVKVTSESYVHEFSKISSTDLKFIRTQDYKINNSEIDCYSDFWSFVYSDIPAPGIQVNLEDKKYVLSGKYGMIVPRHSIIEWKFLAPRITWFAYSSTLPYPSDFPKDVQIYSLTDDNIFLSQDSIKNVIQSRRPDLILSRTTSNAYAEKLKTKIDNSFQSNIDLTSFAKELNISKEWLIKYFKKTFHITPIAYRNKKRLMEAFLRLHLNHNSVLELSHQVGFNDLKQFNTLFKTNMRTQPSKFSK